MNLPAPLAPLEMWGGAECTVNRVGDRYFDQLALSGHAQRPEDLEQFARLGISAIRHAILWEHHSSRRVEDIDWRHSDERLARLRTLGLRPIVGLVHHGSGPRRTSLLDEGFAVGLARFAEAVARRYPWVTDVTPVNEPLTTARFSGLYGHWYPHHRADASYVRALLNQARGVVLAMDAFRQVVPEARLIQTEDCGRTFGRPAMAEQVNHESERRWLTWDLLTGRVDERHPLLAFLTGAGMTAGEVQWFSDARCPPDVLGLNYYLTSDRYLDERVYRYAPDTHGTNGRQHYADVEAVRARPEGIHGHETHLIDAWERYRLPVALTEVHLGCTREEQMRWLVEAWQGARRAREKGVDVRAVTTWALLGSSNWDALVTRDTGHYEPGAFDVRAPVPRATAIATLVQTLVAGDDAAVHPVVDDAGWWHRPDRRPVDGPGPQEPAADLHGRPLLIVGASGTLAQAFVRLCRARGLAHRVVGRGVCDVTDSASVDAVVDEHAPWAVVNATGYVRVDAAEGAGARECRRVNVTGSINLARACRRHGIPLATFSSDLVFDGRLVRPYIEDDAPCPLNVYGASKLEAEREVFALLPEALVVRTSAFFGPWDAASMPSALFRALDGGTTFPAPTDTVVSPTYVPHLVHATLDLLIDGERGAWHLANAGAVSWHAFARTLATRAGRAAEHVTPCSGAELWGAARRPVYSALTSRRASILPSLDTAIDEFLRDAGHQQPGGRVAVCAASA